MRIVSPALKKVVYPAISKLGLLRRAPLSGVAILTYHGVIPEAYESSDPILDGNLVTADQLRAQLRLLKSHYCLISPEQFLAWRTGECELPRRAVLLTCDDGLLNCLTDMLPVLKQEDASCLFFVTGASAQPTSAMLWYEELLLMVLKTHKKRINVSYEEAAINGELRERGQRRAFWWQSVKSLSKYTLETREQFLCEVRTQLGVDLRPDLTRASGAFCRRFRMMNVTELRRLASAGMTIGSHTLSHPTLSHAPAQLAYEEIAHSRVKLESALGVPVWAFAYPFGDPQSVTTDILAMPQRAGFLAAFLNTGGGLGTSLPGFTLPRVHVTADMNLSEFEAHVSGFYEMLQRTARYDSSRSVPAHA